MGSCVSTPELGAVYPCSPGETGAGFREWAKAQKAQDVSVHSIPEGGLCAIPASTSWAAMACSELLPPPQYGFGLQRSALRVSLQSSRCAYQESFVSDASRPPLQQGSAVCGSSCPPSTAGSCLLPRTSTTSQAKGPPGRRNSCNMAPQPVGLAAAASAWAGHDEIVVEGRLGSGGYGAVYRGYWLNKAPAAIKVMRTHNDEAEAVSHAFEMAVLSSVQHPNIVQAYSCLADMVDVDRLEDLERSDALPDSDAASVDSVASAALGAAAAGRGGRFRRVAEGESVPACAVCNVLVMELCDLSTLRDALDRGALRTGGPGSPVDAAAAGQVLLDVASALKYLHSMRLVHGDVKPENVFLKTEPAAALGFVSKLGDFSKCSILDESGRALGLASGPPAPGERRPSVEIVRGAGGPAARRERALCAADDVHSFGTLIWEVFTRSAPPAESFDASQPLPPRPAPVPGPYAGLAAACWARDAASRPTMEELADSLEQLVAADMELRGFE